MEKGISEKYWIQDKLSFFIMHVLEKSKQS